MATTRRVESDIRLEGCRLMFKNFEGRKTEYNDEGNRNFAVVLEPELANHLKEDGWNVKVLPPRDADETPTYYLPVKVRFEPYPPTITLITSRGRKKLTQETVSQLDWTMIDSCDAIIKPYNYPARSGRPAGVAAYLKALYVKIIEDEFDIKYADIPSLDD